MLIKNYIKIFLGISLPFIFISCDNIDEADRYEPVKKPTIEKKLLLLEFTGNRCTNCPKGAAAIHSIQEDYPGDVIAVGLHPEGGGPNTRPIGDQDFRSAEAQVMYEYYLPGGFPCAVFNGDKNTISTSYATWSSDVFEIFQDWESNSVSAGMGILAETSYDATTRVVDVKYSLEMYKNYSSSISVMVWIMENNIIGYQLDGDTYLSDYVHNHVLRASLNGDWGQELPSLQLSEGAQIEGNASLTLDNDWVAENCEIVIFTFQTDNRITEQVSTINVIDKL